MTLKQEQVGEVVYKVFVFRDGKIVTNDDGQSNIAEFVRGIEILESITTASIRAYAMESRSRSKQQQDMFVIRACSDEFIKNEVTNVFGNSNTIFAGEGEASAIIKQILTDKRYLKSKKKFFSETTLNKQQFIATNWRPYDAIYWVAQRAVRKSRKGGSLQNGFCFWENALGFHFKSIDTMISDVNKQKDNGQSNYSKNDIKLYKYVYSPKSTDEGGSDSYKIQSLVFPDERNFLMGLRHGEWSGFSVGFDPVTVSNSDAENKDNPQSTYSELIELQSYQWMRIASLKNIKLIVKIPGNFDLYAGSGISITIPATFRDGDKTPVDKRYSGRYLIASVKHDMVDQKLSTELLLLRDAVI